MIDLSDFKVFDFSEGVPYVSITQNGITFNKSVTLKLDKPEYVRLLINAETRQVVLQSCSQDTPKAVPFYKPKSSGIYSVRWNGRDLLSVFKRLLEDDLEKNGFRVDGELIDSQTMLFDLNTAKLLV